MTRSQCHSSELLLDHRRSSGSHLFGPTPCSAAAPPPLPSPSLIIRAALLQKNDQKPKHKTKTFPASPSDKNTEAKPSALLLRPAGCGLDLFFKCLAPSSDMFTIWAVSCSGGFELIILQLLVTWSDERA
jgi:hypothetical protein